ncbi:MAG: YbhB/YbcL family Raf kinase inhibitor-like protein [Alphaproteobacteria bacterium]|nr:YbhB/YbcL family Raf kinase inhibitor-like protein [Alphaproteobacteria bacterium]
MRHWLPLLSLVAVACSSQAPAAGSLAIDRPETKTDQLLIVSSPAFAHGGPIPARYSAYGANEMPPLAWSALPSGTRSLALLVEDPDAQAPQPFVHWVVWNLVPAAGGLPQAFAAVAQGKNGAGRAGWSGPHPPDTRPHHYHFELFALDTRLDLPADTDRDRLAAAMSGHVVGKGQLVGVFVKPKAR